MEKIRPSHPLKIEDLAIVRSEPNFGMILGNTDHWAVEVVIPTTGPLKSSMNSVMKRETDLGRILNGT